MTDNRNAEAQEITRAAHGATRAGKLQGARLVLSQVFADYTRPGEPDDVPALALLHAACEAIAALEEYRDKRDGGDIRARVSLVQHYCLAALGEDEL